MNSSPPAKIPFIFPVLGSLQGLGRQHASPGLLQRQRHFSSSGLVSDFPREPENSSRPHHLHALLDLRGPARAEVPPQVLAVCRSSRLPLPARHGHGLVPDKDGQLVRRWDGPRQGVPSGRLVYLSPRGCDSPGGAVAFDLRINVRYYTSRRWRLSGKLFQHCWLNNAVITRLSWLNWRKLYW